MCGGGGGGGGGVGGRGLNIETYRKSTVKSVLSLL